MNRDQDVGVTSLPTKPQSRPLFLAKNWIGQFKTTLGRVAIVVAAANGIVTVKYLYFEVAIH